MHVKKFLWFLILCLAVLALFILSIDVPLAGKIRTVAQGHLSNQDILARFYQREKLARLLEDDYSENETGLNQLGNVFLNPDETVGFITDLEKIAQQTGNAFEIKSASESKNGESFLNFRISVLGSFNGFVKFLAGLEDSPNSNYYLVEIEEINIKKMSASDLTKKTGLGLKEGDLESILSIKVYIE